MHSWCCKESFRHNDLWKLFFWQIAFPQKEWNEWKKRECLEWMKNCEEVKKRQPSLSKKIQFLVPSSITKCDYGKITFIFFCIWAFFVYIRKHSMGKGISMKMIGTARGNGRKSWWWHSISCIKIKFLMKIFLKVSVKLTRNKSSLKNYAVGDVCMNMIFPRRSCYFSNMFKIFANV